MPKPQTNGKSNRKTTDITATLLQMERLVSEGATVLDACKQLGVARPSYYRWRRDHEKRKNTETTSSSETAQHLLDVAEAEFAEHGLHISLRRIGRAAGVGNGTLSYHFSSREDLLNKIIARRASRLNDERYKLLDQAESQGSCPDVEDIIKAFFVPALEAAASEDKAMRNYMVVRARVAQDPAKELQRVDAASSVNLHKRFVFALSRALPHLSLEEVYWRYMTLTGVFLSIAQNPTRISRISDGLISSTDPDETMKNLMPLLVPMVKG